MTFCVTTVGVPIMSNGALVLHFFWWRPPELPALPAAGMLEIGI